MYTIKFSRTITITLLLLLSTFVFAQDPLMGETRGGGIVTYEKFDVFDLSEFEESSGQKVKEWLAGMPRGRKENKVLYFNNKHALFTDDPNAENGQLSEEMQVMLEKLPYISFPSPKTHQVYIDREERTVLEQKELMTRLFLVESDLRNYEWKPGTDQVKILGYNCMSATRTVGDNEVKVWFAPSIPIPLGPEEHYGLPGLILAVEVEGKNVFMATSVDLTEPDRNLFEKPGNGRRMKQDAFERLLAEKMEEYRQNKEIEESKKANKF
ncbi:MAG: GLPGLI family protein [Bacteroidota bacterium]|nr:GLPGLI family protein [Bacteroidota bacterium]